MASTSRDSPDDPFLPGFRWQSLFQQSSEPVFVLNRQRRVLFVNRAWEALTGLTLVEVRGQVCRRRPRGIVAEKIELVLAGLTPPPEVMAGEPGVARRAAAAGPAPGSWQVSFFPVRGDRGLLAIVGKILVLTRPPGPAAQPLPEKLEALRQRHAEKYRLDALIGEGPAIQRLREQIRLASQTRLPVLLAGPPGTGKHWAARSIHQLSAQREGAFACLDCARLPSSRSTAILLGTDKSTNFACVYLDNVDCLARDDQERLRVYLEAQDEHAARILAGIRSAPQQSLQAGRLLEDLYCRLSPLAISLPALEDRMEDFEAWAQRLLARASEALERPLHSLSLAALEVLTTHAWPRNFDELYEVLLSACRHAKTDVIEPGDLPLYLRQTPLIAEKPLVLDDILQEVERRLILQALRLGKNNKRRAAELLTVWRARLLRRMEAFGINDDEPEAAGERDEVC